MGVDRNQLNGIESSFNTRQDRNATLAGGGNITWDSGTVEWDSPLIVYLPGASNPVTVTDPGGGKALVTGECLYVDLNRVSGGASSPETAAVTDDLLLTDNIYVLAVHGPGARLHWRDGTVQSDGQTTVLGQTSPGVDRSVVVATGSTAVLVGFDFVPGSGQLLVVVGGIVQEDGRHYTETAGSPGEVEFDPAYVPGSGERIVFMNLNGSQGPSGAATTLQGAYDETPGTAIINVTTGKPVSLRGLSPDVVQTWGTSGTPQQAYVKGSGEAGFQSLLLGASNHTHIIGNRWVLRNALTGRAVLLDPDEGISFGTSNGTIFTPDDAASDGSLRFAYYEVTLDAGVRTQVVLDSEVADNFKGAVVAAYNSAQAKWYCADIAVPQQPGNQLHLIFDAGTGMLILSGTYSGASPVGASFGGETARIVVFY